MFKIIIYLLFTFLIYANNTKDLKVEHGLILDKKGLFTGTVEKYNMKSNVELGVVVDFSFVKDDKEIFNTEVKKNFFWGKGLMNHSKLGDLNLIYDKGNLVKVEGKNFYENWENNQFKKGFKKEKEYEDSSKNPYLEYFDKYSNNVLCNYFKLGKVENGLYTDKNNVNIYKNNKVIKKYTYVSDLEGEISIPYTKSESYYISLNNEKTGELYQAKIIGNEIVQLLYSNLEGPLLVENYNKNRFYRGKNLRNDVIYNESQLNIFYKEVVNILSK